jgi:hypothetical protein
MSWRHGAEVATVSSGTEDHGFESRQGTRKTEHQSQFNMHCLRNYIAQVSSNQILKGENFI